MNTNLAPALLLTAALGAPGAGSDPQLTHINWALEHSTACRRMLFGDLEDFRYIGAEGIVVVLSNLDPSGLESQVVVEKRHDEQAVMRVTTLGVPLVDQLAAVHADAPSTSPDDACKKVQSTFTVTEDPRLEKLLMELRDISMSPVLVAPFVIHGSSYKLWIFAAATESHFQFLGPGSSASRVPSLQAWSDQLLSLAKPAQE